MMTLAKYSTHILGRDDQGMTLYEETASFNLQYMASQPLCTMAGVYKKPICCMTS